MLRLAVPVLLAMGTMLPLPSLCTSADSSHARLHARPFRVGHWNVFWKALDDPAGQEAIKNGIDAAVEQDGHFDFFALLEAAGGHHTTQFPGWAQTSITMKKGGAMQYVHGKSFHESIVLFYRTGLWKPIWSNSYEFERGRPFIMGLFKAVEDGDQDSEKDEFFSCAEAVWVVGAHLPHYSSKYKRTGRKIGDHIRDALEEGASMTGCNAAVTPTVIVGDFNEFGLCSVPPNVTCPQAGFHEAAANMQPLWDYLGESNVADAADPETPTCCTKWHEGVHNDWWHHFDHVYYTKALLNISRSTSFIPYLYPDKNYCKSKACTGPLQGRSPRTQGSWHRGLQVTFTPKQHPERVLVV